jgi:hypothetical protein
MLPYEYVFLPALIGFHALSMEVYTLISQKYTLISKKYTTSCMPLALTIEQWALYESLAQIMSF